MSYNRNLEIAAYLVQLESYDAAFAHWQEVDEKARAQYDELVKAQPPEPPPEYRPMDPPTAPTTPPLYEARELAEQETIETAHGEVIALPGSVVVTGADGVEFVTAAADFARDYTEAAP